MPAARTVLLDGIYYFRESGNVILLLYQKAGMEVIADNYLYKYGPGYYTHIVWMAQTVTDHRGLQHRRFMSNTLFLQSLYTSLFWYLCPWKHHQIYRVTETEMSILIKFSSLTNCSEIYHFDNFRYNQWFPFHCLHYHASAESEACLATSIFVKILIS